jgi:hypothetical protein
MCDVGMREGSRQIAVCWQNCVVSPLPVATHGKIFAVSEPSFVVTNQLTATRLNPVVLPCDHFMKFVKGPLAELVLGTK